MHIAIVAAPVKALAWLGRQGTRAVAALVFIGIAAPPLGHMLKPFVTEAVILLLCISFMRVDLELLGRYLRKPGVVIAATAWTSLAIPSIAGLLCLAAGADKSWPELFLGLMLQAIASPMMASPSLAALMGLDSTLVLITLVTSTALVPFTAPAFVYLFFGDALTLSPPGLGFKLFAILLGSASVAAAIRWIFGKRAIARQREPIDGFNILVLLVFVSAVLGNVAGGFLADPVKVAGFALLAFVVFFALLALTILAFLKAGRERALAIGLMSSQRNMGLMLAATDGALPGLTWLYFAVSQFPIYLSPQLLKPLIRKLDAVNAELTAERPILTTPELSEPE